MHVNEATLVDRITVKAHILGEDLLMNHEHLAKIGTVKPRRCGFLPWRVKRVRLWKLNYDFALWLGEDSVIYREYWTELGGSYFMPVRIEQRSLHGQHRILKMLEHPSIVDWS